MFDIAILAGATTLVLLHLLFFWKALMSRSDISKMSRSTWMMLSLLLGPTGYYVYLGVMPCDLVADE
ncbi:hypothetical protein JYB87_10615 [Shewanella avicenniae]|uniref:Cardiolipin synthase N-terminal domain-containing protein n=1 Tax=Shewanella avicenniae TaxID=2814294 RepID=A0ABX7QLA1_9GAMM|nr:hypothetical protein [Shewanella avicenniae]QSX32232.1 hypothetical protein JYB87_10615 [Shewanella avicenniae]